MGVSVAASAPASRSWRGWRSLREVLTAYDVVVLDGHTDKPRVRNITSVPDKGARIVVHPR